MLVGPTGMVLRPTVTLMGTLTEPEEGSREVAQTRLET